jgi:hypothetical protein
VALLNIDGTRNQVFVFGEVAVSYDSNVFAQQQAQGDYSTTASVGLELKRRAGIISVNARGVLDYVRYGRITGQNAWNPSFYFEFNKTTGRTTGALTVNAYRSSRADSAVNLRTTSWNFPLGLNLKYPISDRFYLTSQTGYLSRRFVDNNALSNYTDYSESVDLYYVYTSKLDLFGGYRVRVADTTAGRTQDQNLSLGVTGGILPKLNGLVRFGLQDRRQELTGEHFNQVSASTALTWNATRKVAVTAQVSRDFSTTATAVSVDSTSALLRGSYVFTRKFQVESSVGAGRNNFLGRSQPARRDEFFSWEAGGTYTFNEHLRVTASYNYLRNRSTLATSTFERNGYSLDIASRF